MTTGYQKPLPNYLNPDASRPFWDGAKRHELMLPHCTICDRVFFYPREACPVCLSPAINWIRASGRGRLHSFTAVHQPANPSFRDSAPYIYAMIELDEGPRMVSNLVECAYEDARVDMPVEAVYDDVTPEVTLVKFRPA